MDDDTRIVKRRFGRYYGVHTDGIPHLGVSAQCASVAFW